MISYKSLRTQPRLDLAALSPLPAPLTIYLEPTNVCNFGCTMCPESFPDYAERAGYYEAMDYELYLEIVRQIQEFGQPLRSLKFYFEGEPLLNRRVHEMIRWAKLQQVAERTELTTNGSMLTAYQSGALIDSGLDYLQVSIYSVIPEDHDRITGQARFRPNDIAANVWRLHWTRKEKGAATPFIHAKLMYDSETGRQKFFDRYRDICDEMSVQAQHNWMGDVRTESLVQIEGLGEQPTQQKRVCPFPFYMLTIKANGDVSVCCVDWRGSLKLGNVAEQSLKQMWTGERMWKIRMLHLAGSRDSLAACRDCDALYTAPDSLDSLTATEYERRTR